MRRVAELAELAGDEIRDLDDLLQDGQRRRVPERHDFLAALELGEEEDLVDQGACVLDFRGTWPRS
jgi:hypothetical protein